MRAFKRFIAREKMRPKPAEDVPIVEMEGLLREEEVGELRPTEPIYVKSMELRGISDVEAISSELRAGNIIILDIASLGDQNPAELKRAIDQLKDVCRAIGGNIGRITESKIITVPKFVTIQFRRAGA